jgi:hypothetical protein
MGMTDRQFDSYQARLLALLKEIEEAFNPPNDHKKAMEKLKRLIQEIDSELKRP